MRERLLTLAEVSRRLGLASGQLLTLVYQHPPVIEMKLVGRAPRFRSSRIEEIREGLVECAIELIERDPKLLSIALGIARAEESETWTAPDEVAVCEMIRDLSQNVVGDPQNAPVRRDFEGEFA